MKVAIASNDKYLKGPVFDEFEKCLFFLFCDTEYLENFEAMMNPFRNLSSGSDIFCTQLIIHRGVQSVIAGKYSANTIRLMQEAGIKIFKMCDGTIEQNIRCLIEGELVAV